MYKRQTVTCAATDSDNPVLIYVWQASGTVTELGPGLIAWTAPESTGTYTINCEVQDGEGGKDQRSVNVLVATGPVITMFTATPEKVLSSGVSALVCVATAPGSGVLTYGWTAASGTVVGSGSSVSWQAPAATGTYLVTCGVSDGIGGYNSQSASILVNNPPKINSLTADPTVVLPLTISTVTCSAADPDNAVLFLSLIHI